MTQTYVHTSGPRRPTDAGFLRGTPSPRRAISGGAHDGGGPARDDPKMHDIDSLDRRALSLRISAGGTNHAQTGDSRRLGRGARHHDRAGRIFVMRWIYA